MMDMSSRTKWKCVCNMKLWSRKTTRQWMSSRCAICKRSRSKCSIRGSKDNKCKPLNTKRNRKR